MQGEKGSLLDLLKYRNQLCNNENKQSLEKKVIEESQVLLKNREKLLKPDDKTSTKNSSQHPQTSFQWRGNRRHTLANLSR